MENIDNKAYFLRNEFVNKLRAIDPATKGLWGKMNVHQMIEHMGYALRQANGKDKYTLVTAEENLERIRNFMMSEKPFRENTPNQLLPDEPAPPVKGTVEEALEELQGEIDYFFGVFEKNPDHIITNPFFGDLNYDMWVHLLHKHAWHHLRQFGVDQ